METLSLVGSRRGRDGLALERTCKEHAVTESIFLANTPRGYRRSEPLQDEFLAAAQTLRQLDGWPNPNNGGERELRADLALEGGGVKGVGLVGAVLALDEAGYRFHRIAGTSAGAVTASIVAGIVQSGADMLALRATLQSLDFRRFMPEGKLHEMMGHAAGHFAKVVTDAALLTSREGLYSGDYLDEWLNPVLHGELGIKTFGDLALTPADDPELSESSSRQYRLVVYTSDLTRARLACLPFDYVTYGVDPDEQDPVRAVRASMSVPFYFEPVHFEALETTVEVEGPGGSSTLVRFPEGEHTWVDGGLLAKFPIHTFDRSDGRAPRWPTIGIKLSQFQTDYSTTTFRESAIAVAVRCLKTMMNEWETVASHQSTVGRTIFVDNIGLSAMDFDLTPEQHDKLFLNGVDAATKFVIEAAKRGGVPRR